MRFFCQKLIPLSFQIFSQNLFFVWTQTSFRRSLFVTNKKIKFSQKGFCLHPSLSANWRSIRGYGNRCKKKYYISQKIFFIDCKPYY